MCFVTGTVKIGTPSKEPGAGGLVSKRKEEALMWSGAGDGNPGGKRRPEGAGGRGGYPGGKRKAQEEGPGPGQDGNRVERGSPQERSVIREWRG